MSFFLKNAGNGKLLYKQDFSESDFINGYQCNTYTVDLPLGKAETTQWCIEGIRLLYTEALFNKPATLEWNGDTGMVTQFFNLKGQLSISNNENNLPPGLSGNQHNIFYCNGANGQLNVEALEMKWFMVQLTKQTFLKLSCTANAAFKRFTDAVSDGEPTVFSDNNLPIDFEIQNCINQIIHCPYADELKPMFLLSKVMELLVLQADSYQRARTVTSRVLKTEYDYERVIFARDYLLKNMDVPPSLTELALIAGINEFKLKKGFKETFNQSVFQYLSNTRLETARTYLLEGSKTPTELAFELGYSSLQHFSTAFKKKFGVPPNQVRR